VGVDLLTVQKLDSEVFQFRESKRWFVNARFTFLVMKEIASVSIMTMAFDEESSALFCFVL